jgi:hypothetical protein
MLRSIVENFLDSVTEREFDTPLLALLASRGFYDIHFTHGASEFGKDVIAKRRDPDTGSVSQFAIQSKAGNIGLGEWRTIRPQVEEALYNTLSHPNFDTNLQRVAILATTGRLTGAAPLDAQQVAQRAREQGHIFEVWDREQFIEWILKNPNVALSEANARFLQVFADISIGTIREQALESYSRRWLPGSIDREAVSIETAAIEAALIANRLRESRRLDLAAYAALHLLRAAWANAPSVSQEERPTHATLAIELFSDYAHMLLVQIRPVMGDPKRLLQAVIDPTSIVTYPVACCRLIEVVALLALVHEFASGVSLPDDCEDAGTVVQSLAQHPGCSRPVSDDFAISLVAPAIVLRRRDPTACRSYLAKSATWTQERYDQQASGLGLGAHGEPEDVLTERLLGSALESTTVQRRRTSHTAVAILDLAIATIDSEVYEVFRHNLTAFDIVPTLCFGHVVGPRDGQNIRSSTVTYRPWSDGSPLAPHHSVQPVLPAIDELLIASCTRSRHNFLAIAELTRADARQDQAAE